MDKLASLVGIVLCVALTEVLCVAVTQARGPLCLHCDAVSSPELCTDVRECWPWESCYAEHFMYTNGTDAFTFGCRVAQQCEQQYRGIQKRLELRLCEQCCTGDICNSQICTNGTAPPLGVPCLTCSNTPSTTSCSRLTYCPHGQVCYAERSTSTPSLSFNMGCLNKELCKAFEEEITGNAEVDASLCHECCEHPGCNHGACAEHQEATTTEVPHTTVSPTTLRPPRDCWDLRTLYNITEDGIYQVLSPSGHYVSHRCDMTTDGGGWIVFQRRYKGAVYFNQTYTKYRSGFGVLSDEFWMGNELLHEFTEDNKQTLRVDICDWGDTTKYAIYDFFSVGPDSDCYRLKVASYHGNAGDALIDGSGDNQFHNNRCFSTFDVDNDISSRHCAHDFKSGWWFGDCFSANLNGQYQLAGPVPAGGGLQWRRWRELYSFKRTEMKFRPSTAVPETHELFKCPVH